MFYYCEQLTTPYDGMKRSRPKKNGEKLINSCFRRDYVIWTQTTRAEGHILFFFNEKMCVYVFQQTKLKQQNLPAMFLFRQIKIKRQTIYHES